MLKQKQKLSNSHYLRVYTIDSAQGQEATMTIMDGSMRWREHLGKLYNSPLGLLTLTMRVGFMDDPKRSNVAMTRAKEVFWVLGDELNLKSSRNENKPENKPLAPFVKLKLELEKTGQVHRFYKSSDQNK